MTPNDLISLLAILTTTFSPAKYDYLICSIEPRGRLTQYTPSFLAEKACPHGSYRITTVGTIVEERRERTGGDEALFTRFGYEKIKELNE